MIDFKTITAEQLENCFIDVTTIIMGGNASTEDYATLQAIISAKKKSSVSLKHLKLQETAQSFEAKILRAFRGKELKGLLDKKKGETLKIVFDIDTFGKVVSTSLSVKRPKVETDKAVKMQGNAKISMKVSNPKMKLIG